MRLILLHGIVLLIKGGVGVLLPDSRWVAFDGAGGDDECGV